MLTSIGYRGKPDSPTCRSTMPPRWCPTRAAGWSIRQTGKPVRGSYVAGWIKRGPTGFIGTNKSCALQTVQEPGRRLQRRSADRPRRPAAALDKLVRARRPDMVDAAGWQAIDAAEIARGGAAGRATSSPRSRICLPRRRPHPRRRASRLSSKR